MVNRLHELRRASSAGGCGGDITRGSADCWSGIAFCFCSIAGVLGGSVAKACPPCGGRARQSDQIPRRPAKSLITKARRPVSRVLSPPERGMAIHLGRPLPDASRDLPGQRRESPPGRRLPEKDRPVAPTRSCSRWGLPCRVRRRTRGALLPHPFTLAGQCLSAAGGLLSVALSLGSPPPGVTRHRASMEPGLSSPRVSPEGGHPAVWHGLGNGRGGRRQCLCDQSISASRAASRAAVPASGSPSTRRGRKWRWKAVTTAFASASSIPDPGTA